MSTLKVDGIRSNSATSDAITLASDGTCTANITNNLSNRNKVINGAMQISQRNTQVTGISSGGYYVCDRWRLGYGNAGIWTLSKSTDTPNNFGSSFKLDCTTASPSLSSTSNLQLLQCFEGQDLQDVEKGTSSAKKITVSFYVKTNKTGTYIVELMDHDNSNRHCSQSYTVSNTNWNRYELTFPADTTGTLDNDNAKSFEVGFWLAAGSMFQGTSLQTTWGTLNQGQRAVGQVNLADSTSNEWYITGVQLEVDHTGSGVATDFEHRSFGQELALCQRYCNVITGDGSQGGNTSVGEIAISENATLYNASSLYCSVPLKVSMRTKPSITVTTGTNYYIVYSNGVGTHVNGSGISMNSNTGTEAIVLSHIGTSVGTGGHAAIFRTYNTNAKITISAEL